MFHFKKLTLVLQDGRAECGHACIVMLAQYWGHDINLNFVRTVYANSDRGMHLGEMKQVFQRLGCHARALRIDPAQIKKISAPLILHWNENHFVVLKKVHRASVTIYDPALGKYRCSWKNFVESFSGVVLEVERASSFQPIREKKELRLLDCLYPIKDIKQWLILSICLACTVESFALLQPLFLQYVTDEVLGAGATNNIKCLAAVFLLCVCAQLFFDWVKGNLSVHVSNMILKQFSRDVMQHLLRLPLSYFEQRFLGDIQAKFRSLEDIQKKIGQDLVRVWLDGIFVLCCTLIMFRYSLFLTAVVWINLMVYLLIRGGAYYYLRSKTDMSWHQHALAASSFLETVRTIISIKCFMKEQVRLNTWYERYLRGVQADAHIAKHHITYQVLSQGILQVDHLLILCIGASMIMNQRFSLGMLMAFLSYRMVLFQKTYAVLNTSIEFGLLGVALQRVSDILFQAPENIAQTSSLPIVLQGKLNIVNLSFRYHPQAKYIFKDFSLALSVGEIVVITGPSGCGKSTLMKVLLGLLPIETGDIFIDDLPLSMIGLDRYRSSIAAVMQEESLLSGSILENIIFFDNQVDLAQVYTAAQCASIHEDILQFPMGYHTMVGDVGATLSGGQKQRILLARALYKRPAILFLDEASSHLDVENERRINNALRQLGITQVIIAHRAETIAMADRVICLGIPEQRGV